jgi:hypothetical protein
MDPVHIDEAYVECEGCGAVWYDLDGDEWVFGDRSVR